MMKLRRMLHRRVNKLIKHKEEEREKRGREEINKWKIIRLVKMLKMKENGDGWAIKCVKKLTKPMRWKKGEEREWV